MVKSKVCVSTVLILIGIELLLVSVLLLVFGNTLIQSNVKKECQLHQGTRIYDAWRNPPLPLTVSFYFFDIVDDEFVNGTKLPIVEQRGPFVYKEVRTKEDVLTYDNGTISYRENRSYTFDESLSVGPESTNITTMNVVYMTFINYFRTAVVPDDVKGFIERLLSLAEQPTMTHSVKELLWGYEDPVLVEIQKFSPARVPSTIVSIYNASVGEAGLSTYLINNGIDVYKNESNRLNKAGIIERYNGQTSLPYWTSQPANMLNGTDSTIWHADATEDDQVYIFSPDLCRSLHLGYSETYDNPFGTENLRFTLPTNVFTNTPENQGFCLNTLNITDNSTYKECLPSGLMSLRSCLKPSGGADMLVPLPIIASFPHFLGAESSVQDAVEGLRPDATIHQSFMDIEPITGTVMNGSRRMQINLNVINSSEMETIARMKPFVFPLMWLDEHAEIDQKNADDFSSSVSTPITILNVVKFFLLALSLLLLITAAVLLYLSYCKDASSKRSMLLNR